MLDSFASAVASRAGTAVGEVVARGITSYAPVTSVEDLVQVEAAERRARWLQREVERSEQSLSPVWGVGLFVGAAFLGFAIVSDVMRPRAPRPSLNRA